MYFSAAVPTIKEALVALSDASCKFYKAGSRRRVGESNGSSGKPNVCLPLTLTGCLRSCLSYFPSTYTLLCGSRPVKEHLTMGPDVRQNVRTCVDVRALWNGSLGKKEKKRRDVGRYHDTEPGHDHANPMLDLHMEKHVILCVKCVRVGVDVFTCFVSVTVLDRRSRPSHIFLSCSSGSSSAYCVLF